MNIFEKLLEDDDDKNLPINPVELYPKLFPKEGYGYLRGIQTEVLGKWHNIRDQRDVVFKMNTGSGKTLTGLLILYSKLIEGCDNAVYLCPDNQLLEQTLEKAELYQIPVCQIDDNNQFPPEFLNGEKVLICTFKKLFNGKSIFIRDKVKIGAIVVDDAHKCVDIARDSVTITLSHTHKIYKRLFKLFEMAVKEQNVVDHVFLKDKKPHTYVRVPYWAWHDNIENVVSIINECYASADEDELTFKWDLVANYLPLYECHFSDDYVELSPINVPFEAIAAFNKAKHRYILSATFSDTGNIIKNFGISRDSVLQPVVPTTTADIGQRLVLAPRRYQSSFSDDKVRRLAKKYADKNYNVAAIVPSKHHSKVWKKMGATVITKENINDSIEILKKSTGNFFVFVNRYDGIDLLGEMCRILILDNFPAFKSSYLIYREKIVETIVSSNKAQLIEQGIGRGVRSGTDYCVILLCGDKLLSFLGYKSNLEGFTPITKEQMAAGLSLLTGTAKMDAESKIEETINLCLKQDKNWKKFHHKIVDEAKETDYTNSQIQSILIAEKENIAFDYYYRKEYRPAADVILKEIVNNSDLNLSDEEKGWYLQMAATLLLPQSLEESNKLQIKAFKMSKKLFSPKGGTFYEKIKLKNSQSHSILKNLSKYTLSTDVIIDAEGILDRLIYSPDFDSNIFEEAIKDLGSFLGFASERPEKTIKHATLDNLWSLPDSRYFLIEVKSRVERDFISKQDIEQLLHSIKWFEKHYGEESKYTPILMHPSQFLKEGVVPQKGTRVLDNEGLIKLKKHVKTFASELATRNIENMVEEDVLSLLKTHQLTSSDLLKYCKKIA